MQIILDYNNNSKIQIYKQKSKINPLFELNEKVINGQINILNNFINNLNLLEPEKNELCKNIDDSINKNCYLCKIEYFINIFNKFSFKFYNILYEVINRLDFEEENDFKHFYEENNKENIEFKSIIKSLKNYMNF